METREDGEGKTRKCEVIEILDLLELELMEVDGKGTRNGTEGSRK